MSSRGIIIRAVNGPEASLAGDAALKFFLRFLTDWFFERVRAAADRECARGGKSGEEGFHPCRLKARIFIARNVAERCTVGRIANVIEPEILLQGYRLGIFPMAMEDGEIEWFSPNPRGILPLAEFHVPHGLSRALRKNQFEIRVDTAFAEVIHNCAAREDTWINAEIIASYIRLHELGHAHSVEAWSEGELAGGLYGVVVGGAFFGESMFHRVTDASKIALLALVERLRARDFLLLDTQWSTDHLQQFGVIDIPRRHYLRLLAEAVPLSRPFA